MSWHDTIVSLGLLLVATLYSAVGHGGASGYLAVLSLANVDQPHMASTALLLNVLVASLSLTAYTRAGHLKLRHALPFVALSVPCAFLGGLTPVSAKVYAGLLALVLGYSAWRLMFFSQQLTGEGETKMPPLKVALPAGAVLGFISGMLGVGGGIFLSPVMLFMRWANAKQTSAIAALFIVLNSIAGICGRLIGGTFTVSSTWPMVAAALIGGAVGANFGANKLSRPAICKTLAAVLMLAVIKLISEAFAG